MSLSKFTKKVSLPELPGTKDADTSTENVQCSDKGSATSPMITRTIGSQTNEKKEHQASGDGQPQKVTNEKRSKSESALLENIEEEPLEEAANEERAFAGPQPREKKSIWRPF